jgi:lysophospholipase L1-like esterase
MAQVKLALLVLGLVLVGLGTVEALLRIVFGFGTPPLYVADTQTGYRLAPSQRIKRFGNRIEINRYSMRSPDITPTPTPDTLRVLLLGDSIANGGWWTDQAETLSTQIQQTLAIQLPGKYQTVEVLNASANSWGPRNELAYLTKFGTFEAQVVILLINTDDLFATAPTSVQVGRDRSYPTRRPPLALVEVLSRFRKAPPLPELQEVQNEGGDRVGANLEAMRQIQKTVLQAKGKLLVAMTPLLREVQPPGSRDYELTARDRLLKFTQAEQIPYIDFLDAFRSAPEPPSLYRDHIHLSPTGNNLVRDRLGQAVQMLLDPMTQTSEALPDSLLEDPW